MMLKTKSLSLRPTATNVKQTTSGSVVSVAAAAAAPVVQNDLNVKQILTNYVNQATNSKYEYDYFLAQLKQKQSDGVFLKKVIIDLKECMQILEPITFENLINSLYFDVKWYLNLDLLQIYGEFLSDLISAYTQYIHKCLTFLIKQFLITKLNDPTVEFDCERLYDFSHSLILSLVKIAPTCKIHIIKLLDTYAPYMIKDTLIQEAFIKNSLKIANNLPDLRLQILEICVQKMLKIDVNAPRDQIINAEFNAEEEEEEMQTDKPAEPSIPTTIMKHPFADRLDAVMLHLFEFIHKSCNQTNEAVENKVELDWNECKSVYKDLLFTFDKYILRTYGSSHVQFLLFYICSYRTSLSEGYLDYLWKKFSNPNTCPITRQLCTYYIGSFLSRANYIPLSTIIASMQLMCTWLLNYIDKIDASKSYPSIDLHRTFYALCQTVFYIFIFRHRELISANLIDTVKSWKFSVICSSKLNPLRFCLPTVTKKFASLARLYQLAYCYTIIDTNNRLTLPSIGENSGGLSINTYHNTTTSNVSLRKFFNTTSIDSSFTDTSNTLDSNNNGTNIHQENPLDSFFPFDPYLLTRSKVFIDGLYQNYVSSNDDENNEDMVTDEEAESDDDSSSSDDDDDDDDNDNNDDKKVKHHNPWSEDDEI